MNMAKVNMSHVKPEKELGSDCEHLRMMWDIICGCGQCTSHRENPRATAGGCRGKAASGEGETASFDVESTHSTTQCQ